MIKKLEIRDKKEKNKKKGNVSKWKIEHDKVVADVEPILATIKTFDCNRLYWVGQHMAQQRRKCLDSDTKAKASVRYYSKWVCTTRNAGKLSRDVSSDKVGDEESDEESEEDGEEDGDD